MNPLLQARFSFTEAALAAGVKPTTLRNWLDRNQISLDAEKRHDGESWRRFSALDAIRIALVSRLVDRCVPVVTSSGIVEAVISSHFCMLLAFKNIPLNAVVAAFKNKSLCVYEGKKNSPWALIPTSAVNMKEAAASGNDYLMVFFLDNILAEVFENLGIE